MPSLPPSATIAGRKHSPSQKKSPKSSARDFAGITRESRIVRLASLEDSALKNCPRGLVFHSLLVSLFLSCLPASPARSQSESSLSQRIQKVISRPEFAHANFGIEFYSLDTGKVIYALNADKLFVPASTTKTLTEGALLAKLGADYRFHTRVYRTGPIDKHGALKGDLILVASGDPNLSNRVQPDGTLAFVDHDHSYNGPALPGDPLAEDVPHHCVWLCPEGPGHLRYSQTRLFPKSFHAVPAFLPRKNQPPRPCFPAAVGRNQNYAQSQPESPRWHGSLPPGPARRQGLEGPAPRRIQSGASLFARRQARSLRSRAGRRRGRRLGRPL